MPTFAYEGFDQSSAAVHGTVEAASREEAVRRLRGQGHYATDVRPVNGRATARAAATPAPARRRRVKRGEIINTVRQLSDLVSANLPMDRCLTVVVEQAESAALRGVLEEVQQHVRGGQSLSEALAGYPRLFPPLLTSSMSAGEAGGELGGVLQRLADYLEWEQNRRSQILSALMYPAILLTVAVGASAFLLTVVVPRIAVIFQDLGQALPLPTQVLLALAAAARHYWWAPVVGGMLVWFFSSAYAATPLGRLQLGQVSLAVPVVGSLRRSLIISRTVRSLGTMLAGGVPMLSALDLAGKAADHPVFEEALSSAAAEVRHGESVATALNQTGRFPPLVIHMTAVGEETGALAAMLIRAATSLERQVELAQRRLITLMEPAVLLLMGLVVGFIVIAILLPIFQMNAALGGS